MFPLNRRFRVSLFSRFFTFALCIFRVFQFFTFHHFAICGVATFGVASGADVREMPALLAPLKRRLPARERKAGRRIVHMTL